MASLINLPPVHERIDRAIATSGFSVVSIGYAECLEPDCAGCAEELPWTYTVGLTDHGLPELALMGLDPLTAHFAISWVAEERRAGRRVALHSPFELRGLSVKVVEVPHEWLLTDPTRMSVWFARYSAQGTKVALPAVQQVLWADEAGRFPDESRWHPSRGRRQPVLVDDPFSEPHRRPGSGRAASISHLRVA